MGREILPGCVEDDLRHGYCYYDRPTCEALALRLPASMYDYVSTLGASRESSASHWEFTVRLQQLLLMKKEIIQAF